jgi:lysophospholipase L1-like esterase
MKTTIAEVGPDLVIWQVGTNDALARVDLESFAQSVQDTIAGSSRTASMSCWSTRNTPRASPATRTTTRSSRRSGMSRGATGCPWCSATSRCATSRAGQPQARRVYLAKDQFHLNDLGYRCMAEHVARAITVSLLQPEPPAATAPRASRPRNSATLSRVLCAGATAHGR